MRVLDEHGDEVALKDSSEEEEEANLGMTVKDDKAFIDLGNDDDDDMQAGDLADDDIEIDDAMFTEEPYDEDDEFDDFDEDDDSGFFDDETDLL